MKISEFAEKLAAWRDSHGYTDAQAAVALGCSYGSFRRWLSKGCKPSQLTMAGVMRRMREGVPTEVQRFTPIDLAFQLKRWRIKHGFSQREAAIALQCNMNIILRLERCHLNPSEIAVTELLRRFGYRVNVRQVKEIAKGMPLLSREEFGQKLREWRKRHGFTRARAVRALRAFGFSTVERTIWVWETGRERPWNTKAVIDALAKEPPEEKPIITPEEFGMLFKLWRKAHGLNQLQASLHLGLGRDHGCHGDQP